MNPSFPSHERIRVLIADDSAFMRTALSRMVESDPALEVVGTAQNGLEALEKVAALDPDVLTLDIEMPRLDGLGVLRQLMENNPKPVIMVSSLTQEGAEATLEAFDLGAVDCIPKQSSYASLQIVTIREELVAKIKAAAKSRPFRKAKKAVPADSVPRLVAPTISPGVLPPAVVAIGTSTGGPKALQEVLPRLPANLQVGLVVVQHMPPGFTGPFARRLDSLCQVTVSEATEDASIEPGLVLLAPAGWHMTVYRRTHTKYAVRIAKTPANTLHMPSVDVTMLSVAEVFGPLSMGIIMTGMGYDGAEGMKAIFAKGGYTVGQDEATCVVYGMPRACAEAGTLRRVLPLERIADEICAAIAPRLKTA
jgi:two-component system chemotaxis response regulator CheB